MAMNTDLTNFGGSRTNSIAPPPVQKLNIEMVIAPEPLIVEEWNLVHPICSLDADHIQIAYIKTPYITVAAILKSTVFCLFLLLLQNWSNSPKLAQMIFGLSRTEWLNRIFWLLLKKKLWCCELNEGRPKLVQRLYLDTNFDQSKRNLVLFVNTMVWGSMPSWEQRHLWVVRYHNSLFAYNFLLVCQKLCSWGLWIPWVMLNLRMSILPGLLKHVSAILKFVMNCNISEPFDISVQKSVGDHQHMSRRYPGSLKTAPPSVPEINKTAYNFWNVVQNASFLCCFVPWVMPILTMSHL